ncbi:MAG: penicillin acylase family protein [Acidobacteria bacterium]|nr:penicillin acylase family protein [Acidobacteriota bacterium]
MRRLLRVVRWLLLLVILLTLITAGWAWIQLGRSLPQLDGTLTVAGLSAPVTVDRDALGVPTIKGSTRLDVARALGFIHAQDRFFQMDLSRRRAAGELSELFGRAALTTDQGARLHRFRHRAAAVIAATSPSDLALADAYVDGVNAGLKALDALPFEYLLLGQTPAPWTREDSILVIASMFFSLQDSTAGGEARAALLHEAFPAGLAEFLNSTSSEWDTPMHGEALPPPTPPPATVFDLRNAVPASPAASQAVASESFLASIGLATPEDARGSNNWAVAGSRTSDGRALISDDMHLGLSVPNIWYRASLAWTDDRGPHQVSGITLPGTASVVVGSNGHVAWGFTNTTADWSDRVLIETVPGDPTRYLTPEGPRAFDVTRERIGVDDEEDQWLDVRETIWGPVAAPDHKGRLFAIAWVAHSPEGMNFRMSQMEHAASLEEAIAVANQAGIPGQNCVIADNQGQIAWTVAGRIPKRVGFTGQLPVSWADGTRRWSGWYDSASYPRIVNPADAVIVTANNRIVSGEYLAMLGDGGYDPGAREADPRRHPQAGAHHHRRYAGGTTRRPRVADGTLALARDRDHRVRHQRWPRGVPATAAGELERSRVHGFSWLSPGAAVQVEDGRVGVRAVCRKIEDDGPCVSVDAWPQPGGNSVGDGLRSAGAPAQPCVCRLEGAATGRRRSDGSGADD